MWYELLIVELGERVVDEIVWQMIVSPQAKRTNGGNRSE